MALLISRTSLGGTDTRIAADLTAAIDRVAARQTRAIDDDDGMSVVDYRAWFDEYAALIVPAGERPQVPAEDRDAGPPGAPVRVRDYRPERARSVVLFVHGGAWIMGNLETHDHICRWLAASANCRVISVDYALAPEVPAPRASAQVAGVLEQVLQENDLPVFVAGDSAGAQIASLAIMSTPRPLRERIAGFISIYGAYSPKMDLSSHMLFGDGRFGLSQKQMSWAWNLYAPHLSSEERVALTPLGRPLDHFPPTLCIGAECDLLLDDTLAFYSTLARTGGDVTLALWAGINHGALHFVGVVDSVTHAAQSIVQYIVSRSPGNVGLSEVRSIESIAVADDVQLPMLSGNEAYELGYRPTIETPHLTSRTRRHGTLSHQLGRDIVAGVYEPGRILDSGDETSEVSISRGSYREAMRTLAAKGLITATPKVGTRVAPRSAWRLLDPDVLAWLFEASFNEQILRNVFEYRKVVEPSAAALAAIRATAEERAALAESVLVMARSPAGDPAWRPAMLRFHDVILHSGDNEILAATWPSIQVIVSWSSDLAAAAGSSALNRDRARDYASVLDKITLRDPQGAMVAMARLIDGAMADVIDLLRAQTRRSDKNLQSAAASD